MLPKVLKHAILTFFWLAFISANAQYIGGFSDGYNSAVSCDLDLAGVGLGPIIIGSINGPSTFCANGGAVYSVNITSGTANSYSWIIPSGASLVFTSNTLTSSTISVLYGAVGGNISVTASNGCSSGTPSALVVSPVACNLFLGGTGDGFSFNPSCDILLSGASSGSIVIGAITGASVFCSNGSGNYSVFLSSGTASSFAWTLPPGATISWISNSLTSSSILVQFASTAGSIGVTASNLCSSVSPAALVVNPASCNLYFGGTQDGFSSAPTCDVTGIVLCQRGR
jgi:hypothetical protein